MVEKQLVDIAAERAVLSGICQYGNEVYADVADIVSVTTFTSESNQVVFKCIEHLLKNQDLSVIDIPSIFSAANDIGLSSLTDKPDWRNYIRSLMNFSVNQSNIRRMAGKIRKLEIARLLQIQLEQAKGSLFDVTGDEPVDQILGLAENPIFDFSSLLNNSQGDGPQLISNGIESYINHIINNPREMIGISTGYPYFDKAIGGGLRRKTVNLIGARPKTGKTMLADNVALYIAGVLGIPVLNLDTEMSQEDHWNRMIANLASVPMQEIESGKFSQNQLSKKKVFEAVDKLKNMPYHYKSIAGQPFEETVAMMRRWVTKTVDLEESGQAKPCVIIYDYLKLMDSSGLSKNMQEYQLLGFQMTGLHNFMVRYGVPCLAFIQLNRDGINKEDTDVASGSDRLIWLCSNFSIYKKKSEEEIAEEQSTNQNGISNRKLIPIVCRHGEGLEEGDYINMNMTGKFARITEGRTRNELHKIKSKGELINDPNDIPEEQRQF